MTFRHKKYFIVSIVFHVVLIFALILGFDYTSPLPVFENTNKNDVISAVILGDTADSKILPQASPPKPVEIKPIETKPEVKPITQKTITPPKIKKDVIALEVKKKTIQKKILKPLPKDIFAKDLLADIKNQHDKQKKIKQKQLKTQFEKTLQEQAEKSLRQQLLNEEIKLQGKQSRQAQGEVNKFKALILQVISDHWIIPTQANKKLYCELMIRLAPGGMVLDVQITKTSGDPSLDSSARAAVLKASPLPVPKDPAAFEAFRQFVLKVKPENIIASE